MNFRAHAEMLVLFPKRIFAAYRDLTMPLRNWSKFDSPSCDRLPARSVCAQQFGKRTANSWRFANERRKVMGHK
jgi:hypothetical protein